MQLVRHANRGRLLLRTPGPFPYWICKCSFVETTDTQSYITPVYVTFPWLYFLPTLTLLLNTGFNRASATGVACRQGTLNPPDTWSCPILGLACVLMSRSISPELVLSPDLWISNTPRYFSFAFWQRLFSVSIINEQHANDVSIYFFCFFKSQGHINSVSYKYRNILVKTSNRTLYILE